MLDRAKPRMRHSRHAKSKRCSKVRDARVAHPVAKVRIRTQRYRFDQDVPLREWYVLQIYLLLDITRVHARHVVLPRAGVLHVEKGAVADCGHNDHCESVERT